MMRPVTNIQELSHRIAQSIIEKLALERESGRISQDHVVIDLEGFLSGDQTSRIAFGSFDIAAANFRDEASLSATPALQGAAEDAQLALVDLAEARRTRQIRARRRLFDASDAAESSKRRKITGSLRLARTTQPSTPQDPDDADAMTGRRLESHDARPQRKGAAGDGHSLKPSTLQKLVTGIFEQIFSSMSFDVNSVVDEWRKASAPRQRPITDGSEVPDHLSNQISTAASTSSNFSQMNVLCRKISQASRVSRALEVIVQARWIEHFDNQVQMILADGSQPTATKARMHALAEACRDFGWTEKELRNKMAIWRGYKELKDAGGWAVLVFAGNGIYRFCKYRISFENEAMQHLRRLRSRFEVAADALHPHWREMLSIVDAASPRIYTGHPHDWVVSDFEDPVPLAQTYLQWDPQFSYSHLDSSIIDAQAWGASDPRLITVQSSQLVYVCAVCSEPQSEIPQENSCRCFPNLYGCGAASPCPVQVFRTKNGRNNGLISCCAFERGAAIGEFIGLVTKGLDGVDIMQAQADQGKYQIWQGREGNHTRFVNHSCRPNSQFQRFVWMGVQRVVLVSRGIDAGAEITADYSDSYWRNLEKICLCNEACCRFKERRQS